MFNVLDAIRRDAMRRLIGEEQQRINTWTGHQCGDHCAAERDQGGPVNQGRMSDSFNQSLAAAAVPCRCGGVMRPGVVHYCTGRATV